MILSSVIPFPVFGSFPSNILVRRSFWPLGFAFRSSTTATESVRFEFESAKVTLRLTLPGNAPHILDISLILPSKARHYRSDDEGPLSTRTALFEEVGHSNSELRHAFGVERIEAI
jgi:hypothetical protein